MSTSLLALWNSSSSAITVRLAEDTNSTPTYGTYNPVAYDSAEGKILLLRTSQKTTSTTAINYNGSAIDTYCNETFYNALPSGIQALIKETSIRYVNPSDTGTYYTLSRKCFIPSAYEVGGGNSMNVQDGTLVWDTNRYSKSTGSSWWLRSPYSSSVVRYANSSGSLSYNTPSSSSGVRVAFWVAAATLVDDEVANTIIPKKLVEFTQKVGESANLVNRAKINTAISGTADVITYQFTNNYGDDEPTWEDCDSTGYIEPENETKETTNYELGVKIHAEFYTSGSVGQPIITYTTTLESSDS